MKMRFSVGFAGASGKAGDVVAANWKGRYYLRGRVIPANPKSAGQLAQRLAFANCVDCFQHLPALLKTFLDKLGSDSALSGFAIMMKASVAEERTTKYHSIVPNNRYVEPINGFAVATGVLSGELALTWDTDAWAGTDVAVPLIRESPDAGTTYATPWSVASWKAATDMSDGAGILDGLTPTATYAVCLMAKPADDDYSGGAIGHAVVQT